MKTEVFGRKVVYVCDHLALLERCGEKLSKEPPRNEEVRDLYSISTVLGRCKCAVIAYVYTCP